MAQSGGVLLRSRFANIEATESANRRRKISRAIVNRRACFSVAALSIGSATSFQLVPPQLILLRLVRDPLHPQHPPIHGLRRHVRFLKRPRKIRAAVAVSRNRKQTVQLVVCQTADGVDASGAVLVDDSDDELSLVFSLPGGRPSIAATAATTFGSSCSAATS